MYSCCKPLLGCEALGNLVEGILLKMDNQEIIHVLNTRFNLFPAYELIPTVICEWSIKFWNAFDWTIERNFKKLYLWSILK